MQPTRDWMPGLAPQPGPRDSKAVRRPGSQRAEKIAVLPEPGSLGDGGRTRMHAV